MTTVAPRLLTGPQLREYLGGISQTTLWRWIAEGRIPGPMAGTTRWDREAVDRAIDAAAGIAKPAAPTLGERAHLWGKSS